MLTIYLLVARCVTGKWESPFARPCRMCWASTVPILSSTSKGRPYAGLLADAGTKLPVSAFPGTQAL